MSDGDTPLCDALPAALMRAPSYSYPPRVALFREGETAAALFVIRGGSVKLVTQSGDCDVIVGLRHRGSLLGAASEMLDRAQPTTAETLTPCARWRIDGPAFQGLLGSDPAFGQWVHGAFAREVWEQTRRIAVARQDPVDRLVWLLEELMPAGPLIRRSYGWLLVPPLTRAEMGQIVSLTPEHVSRLLRRLEEQGVLRRDDRWIVVPHDSPLAAAAAVAARSTPAPPPKGETAPMT